MLDNLVNKIFIAIDQKQDSLSPQPVREEVTFEEEVSFYIEQIREDNTPEEIERAYMAEELNYIEFSCPAYKEAIRRA